MPAVEASRRASALTGRTFLKHQGTLVLKELSNWHKERKSYFRYGARNICSTRPCCSSCTASDGSGALHFRLASRLVSSHTVIKLVTGDSIKIKETDHVG